MRISDSSAPALGESELLEQKLIDLAASCVRDPMRFVMLAYPWGEPGALETWDGPDTWQAEILRYIRDNLTPKKPLQIAIAGGVGPGKTALACWIVDWAMTTFPDCRGRATANTGVQLSTTTWPELAKWRGLSLFSHWFEFQSRSLVSIDAAHRQTWKFDALTWDEKKPETFRGFHNARRRMITVNDESSAIPDVIWEAEEGFLADKDTERIWLCLGNPTRATGRFRQCFPGGRHHQSWKCFNIDTRTARMANQEQIAEWIRFYGIEHDFVRVNVLSLFPRASSTQFIASDVVDGAAAPDRDPPVTIYDALVIGVDIAAYGDDQTVIRFRRGRDARTIPVQKYRGLDMMQIAARVAEANERHHPDAIFIDQGNMGLGVVDRCRQLQLPVYGIDFGAEPDSSGQDAAYYNKRAEMWGKVRDWLPHGMIDDDPELKAGLTAVQYGFKLRAGRDAILLERKKDMKARGLASPDDADALALTFALPVAPSDHTGRLSRRGSGHQVEYDPFKGMYDRR